MHDVEPHVEQLPHELEPLDAAVSPKRDASETSITSISSNPLKISVIISPPLCLQFDSFLLIVHLTLAILYDCMPSS